MLPFYISSVYVFNLCLLHYGAANNENTESSVYTEAELTVTYENSLKNERSFEGYYEKKSLLSSVQGYLYFSKVHDYWCTDIGPPNGNHPNWIALIPSGNCSNEYKISLAKKYNATGVIIYSDEIPKILQIKTSDTATNIVTVLVSNNIGHELVDINMLFNNAYCQIKIGLVGLGIVTSKAFLTVRYENSLKFKKGFVGKYGDNSLKTSVKGYLYFSKAHANWCSDIGPPRGNHPIWIALIPRGNCSYQKQISLAKKYHAAGVIIYNTHDTTIIPQMQDRVPNIVSVIVSGETGHELVDIKNAYCKIQVKKHVKKREWKVSRTSVLFVLVSFILLMCISLAWLVFYYVQRFRHIYRNDRKEKQLLSAAKKAISKLKTVSFQHDSEEDESCAICLDNYKDGETLRILPCKHSFHKSCIDPWLLTHRTCPMCKSNILKALGVELPFVNVESPTATSVHPSAIPLPMQETSRQINTEATVSVATNTESTVPDVNTPQAWQTSLNIPSYSSSSSTSSEDTGLDTSTVALVTSSQRV